jgi:hypothetical protein
MIVAAASLLSCKNFNEANILKVVNIKLMQLLNNRHNCESNIFGVYNAPF